MELSITAPGSVCVDLITLSPIRGYTRVTERHKPIFEISLQNLNKKLNVLFPATVDPLLRLISSTLNSTDLPITIPIGARRLLIIQRQLVPLK